MPRAIPPLELASTRIEASTVPMHGAATIANAPPRSSGGAGAAGAVGSPGTTVRSGHGSRPTNARPSTTRMKPAIVGLGRLVDRARDRRRGGAEQHEDDREAAR